MQAGRLAVAEHNALVTALVAVGINVIVEESHDTDIPDACFPNNWISFHGIQEAGVIKKTKLETTS